MWTVICSSGEWLGNKCDIPADKFWHSWQTLWQRSCNSVKMTGWRGWGNDLVTKMVVIQAWGSEFGFPCFEKKAVSVCKASAEEADMDRVVFHRIRLQVIDDTWLWSLGSISPYKYACAHSHHAHMYTQMHMFVDIYHNCTRKTGLKDISGKADREGWREDSDMCFHMSTRIQGTTNGVYIWKNDKGTKEK